MATAKVAEMAFDTWWAERVELVPKASAAVNDLYRDHKRHMGHRAVGRQTFVAYLNRRKVRETTRAGVRMRWGLRLRAIVIAGAPDITHTGASIGPDVIRSVPFVGDPVATEAMQLPIDAPEDYVSARVVWELYGERRRQRAPVAEGGEGRTAAGDDDPERAEGDLAAAACAYAYAASQPEMLAPFLELNAKVERPASRRGWMLIDFLQFIWPWAIHWWKPKTGAPGWRRRCLVRAGGLIVAAIEKLDRADARATAEATTARPTKGE